MLERMEFTEKTDCFEFSIEDLLGGNRELTTKQKFLRALWWIGNWPEELARYHGRKIHENKERKKYNAVVTGLMQSEEFKEFESRFEKYGLEKEPFYKYLDRLFIVDELESALTDIDLPDKINVLDVGAGLWHYANALNSFLSYGGREVNLKGVDKQANWWRRRKVDFELVKGDVMDMEGNYDLIFMRKMLSSPEHFKKWKLDPTNLIALMEKCSSLLSDSGIQVMISPVCGGEYYKIVEHIPMEKRIAEFQYKIETGNSQLDEILTPGIMRTYLDGVCVSKK